MPPNFCTPTCGCARPCMSSTTPCPTKTWRCPPQLDMQCTAWRSWVPGGLKWGLRPWVERTGEVRAVSALSVLTHHHGETPHGFHHPWYQDIRAQCVLPSGKGHKKDCWGVVAFSPCLEGWRCVIRWLWLWELRQAAAGHGTSVQGELSRTASAFLASPGQTHSHSVWGGACSYTRLSSNSQSQ